MASHMNDDLGFFKGSSQSKRRGASVYGKPTSSSSSRLNMEGRSDASTTLAQPFKTPTIVNPSKTRSKITKSEDTSDIDENRPSRIKVGADSSDDEPDTSNDIPPQSFVSKKTEASKASAIRSSNRITKDSSRMGTRSPQPGNRSREPKSSQEETQAYSPKKVFKTYKLESSPEPEIKAEASRTSFRKVAVTASPEPEPVKRRAFVKPVIEEEVDEEEIKKSIDRAAILRELGGDIRKIKRTLIDAGLGAGLENIDDKDIYRSPPKKIATANQGLSSLAGRIATRRTKTEDEADVEVIDVDAEECSCPMCHEAVPYALLMAFSNNRPRSLNTRQQAAFCVHHKQESAQTTYTRLGYPTISWDAFDNKLKPHFTYISRLITSPDTTPSHYRSLFASDIKHGRNRTLKQTIMGANGLGSTAARVLIPGYYGPRGARAMQEAILLKFNRELRKAAVKDNVVSARAVGGYVASVLVPELGTRLIMEDMKIGEEEAREVMEKSAALGSLVNEEVKDVTTAAEQRVEEGADYD